MNAIFELERIMLADAKGLDSLTASGHRRRRRCRRHQFEALLNHFSPMSIFLSILDKEPFDGLRVDRVSPTCRCLRIGRRCHLVRVHAMPRFAERTREIIGARRT